MQACNALLLSVQEKLPVYWMGVLFENNKDLSYFKGQLTRDGMQGVLNGTYQICNDVYFLSVAGKVHRVTGYKEPEMTNSKISYLKLARICAVIVAKWN